jgi:diguanylate cyclase (GGDEF)-like protein
MDLEDQQLLKDLGAMVVQEISSIQMATLDDLTLISNRRGFLSLADYGMKVGRRNRVSMTLLLFDLDKFKAINDKYGHHEGDFILSKFAEIMIGVFRESDIIGRLGGDEFVILVERINERHSAQDVADKLRTAFEEPFLLEGTKLVMTPSIGVAVFPFDGEDELTLLRHADNAMYVAKGRQRLE